MSGGIYTIRIKGTKKFYVGRTQSFRRRKSDHIWHLKNNTHGCRHLQNAYNKYGEIIFVEEQHEDDKEKRIALEQEWLDRYGKTGVLFNHQMVASHDIAGFKWSEESKKKYIPHNLGKPSPFKGLKRDPEVGKKISASKKGKPLNEKQLAALSENRKNIDKTKKRKPMSDDFRQSMIGNTRGAGKRSEAARKAISEGKKGMKFSEAHRLALSIAAKNRKAMSMMASREMRK